MKRKGPAKIIVHPASKRLMERRKQLMKTLEWFDRYGERTDGVVLEGPNHKPWREDIHRKLSREVAEWLGVDEERIAGRLEGPKPDWWEAAIKSILKYGDVYKRLAKKGRPE